MNAYRAWALVAVVALAGCGDGSIQSPDFTSVTTVNSVTVTPATLSLPAGTLGSLAATADVTTTQPPPVGEQNAPAEPITDKATWSSSDTSIATVSAGQVTALSPGSVTITASYMGKSASTQVTVSNAILTGVLYIVPRGQTRDANDAYFTAVSLVVPFDIYGQFSDGSQQLLDQTKYNVAWTSSDAAVADNGGATPDKKDEFTAVAVGMATIQAVVTPASPPTNTTATLTPDNASATLTVKDFCLTEFVAPAAKTTAAEPSAFCLGCDVSNPGLMIDGNHTTFAEMLIPSGLALQSDVAIAAYDNTVTLLTPGIRTGIIVSQPVNATGELTYSTSVQLITQQCDASGNCVDVESFPSISNGLTASALGTDVSGSAPTGAGTRDVGLIYTDPLTKSANGLKVIFNGGVLSGNATLDVNGVCGEAIPPAP